MYEVRRNSAERMSNWANCDGYGCEKLAKIHEEEPDAKINLEEIREG